MKSSKKWKLLLVSSVCFIVAGIIGISTKNYMGILLICLGIFYIRLSRTMYKNQMLNKTKRDI
ncbi:MAG: hypothetical protein LKF87_08640 [Clostridium tyrobutyricum]|jgi:uncharacterized membrane protein HdeD (DUF308 family)|uniref:hypothetical protein n=1 Tax=Clostridium tyrobutyricum TaxID=1519 RepID=UPI00242E286A|nr:hypothetical protein [Clostridium tyrobutyricum]MCH4198511.1 hypothetical protein [Clostridium tyrobutyricum]MCH4237429.1 hypothetical protein [Clostridium tyrobutyricum]MCH4259020.1 hypothetical protein [Clostridium tyrobutyricum]MCI1239872.1 hypothetical protein [Clostridium tyrobutyricum]MCI1652959.1 hypothetical protein [Clostridium tyrobutyricum]